MLRVHLPRRLAAPVDVNDALPPLPAPPSPLFAPRWRADVRVQYAVRMLPILLWLGSYVLSRYAPALVPAFALRFAFAHDDNNDGGQHVHATTTAAAASSDNATSSSSSSSLLVRVCVYLVHAALSLVRGPLELCRRHLLHRVLRSPQQQQQQQTSLPRHDDGSRGAGVWRALLTCATSLLVHADYASLVDTAFTYLTMDVLDKRSHALGDFVGGLIASTLTNAYVRATVRCLDGDGSMLLSSSHATAHNNSGSGNRTRPRGLQQLPALYKLAPIAYFLVSLLSATNQFPVSVLSQTRLSNMELREYTSSSSSSIDSSNDSNRRGSNGAARTSSPARVDTTTASPQQRHATRASSSTQPDMFVYLCGGKGFTYALAGYRFGRYGDIEQCAGALWSYAIDVVELVMHRVVEDSAYTLLPLSSSSLSSFASSRRALRDDGDEHGASSSSGSHNMHSNDAATTTAAYVLRPNSSADVVRSYLLYFTSGVGVALVVRHAPALWRRLRPHVPLLPAVLDWLWPPPLPPLCVPDEVVENASAQQGMLRVRVAPSQHDHDSSSNDDNRASNRSSSGGGGGDDVAGEYVCIPVPAECFCPITYTIMRDPVSTVDGFTYEREAIVEWLRVHNTAPMTNLPLRSAALTSNVAVRARIADVVRAYEAARRKAADAATTAVQ